MIFQNRCDVKVIELCVVYCWFANVLGISYFSLSHSHLQSYTLLSCITSVGLSSAI